MPGLCAAALITESGIFMYDPITVKIDKGRLYEAAVREAKRTVGASLKYLKPECFKADGVYAFDIPYQCMQNVDAKFFGNLPHLPSWWRGTSSRWAWSIINYIPEVYLRWVLQTRRKKINLYTILANTKHWPKCVKSALSTLNWTCICPI